MLEHLPQDVQRYTPHKIPEHSVIVIHIRYSLKEDKGDWNCRQNLKGWQPQAPFNHFSD